MWIELFLILLLKLLKQNPTWMSNVHDDWLRQSSLRACEAIQQPSSYSRLCERLAKQSSFHLCSSSLRAFSEAIQFPSLRFDLLTCINETFRHFVLLITIEVEPLISSLPLVVFAREATTKTFWKNVRPCGRPSLGLDRTKSKILF